MSADYETENLKGWTHEEYVYIADKGGAPIGNFTLEMVQEIVEIMLDWNAPERDSTPGTGQCLQCNVSIHGILNGLPMHCGNCDGNCRS